MKICLAQIKPVKGDIKENILQHLRFIDRALDNNANMIVFPELSITGYEPALAAALATRPDDPRFNEFQETSTSRNITIAIGLPVTTESGISISLMIFQPGQNRKLYSKKYLHQDEAPFFIPGESFPVLPESDPLVAFAICYELSVPAHAALAAASGAAVYIASVAKTASGMDKACETMTAIAAHYKIPVLLVNSIGPCDNFESAGRSAAWNSSGRLIAQLDSNHEGILVFDTGNCGVSIKSWKIQYTL